MSRIFETPAVTVIVPVYNSEKYLDKTISSVLTQTFTNWSLLLVDDGSTDDSGRICDRYAAQDERIRVFHTGNRGYACARNLGLRHAAGEWVMFLDSDDCLAPSALLHMLERTDHTDMVMALYQTMPQSTMKEEGIMGGCFEQYSELAGVMTELYEPYFFLSVTAKLYRRSILGNGFYTDEGPLMSDWLFNFQILPSCRGICFMPEIVYYYRLADHISTCSYFHSEWLYISKKVYETVIGLFPGDPQTEAFMSRRYANRVCQHLTAIASLHNVTAIQKLAMVEAERDDPFYQKPAICQAVCGRKTAGIWKAFLARDAEGALKAARQLPDE